LKHQPYSGVENLLEVAGVSDNAISIIKESVQVIRFNISDNLELTLTQEPGVEIAKFPDPISVVARPGQKVEGQQPWTGEQASFSWSLTSPVSLQIAWLSSSSELAETSIWVFYPVGAQCRTVLSKGGYVKAVANTFWERSED